MKKLTKVLARMARDGDVETVAELIEELLGEEPTGESGVPVAVAVATAEPANAPVEGNAETAGTAGNGENGGNAGNGNGGNAGNSASGNGENGAGEGPEVHDSQEAVEAILGRLDRIIELLTPGTEDACGEEKPEDGTDEGSEEEPDDEPDEKEVESLVGAVAEAIREAEASGDPEKQEAVKELGEAIETILDPEVSTTVEEERENGQIGADTMREIVRVIQPALARLPRKQQKKTCRDLGRILRKDGRDSGVYAGLIASAKTGYVDDRELGRMIMRKRNPNYEE